MKFSLGAERNNDFVKAVLLEIKSKKGLTLKEGISLKRLMDNYKHAIKDERKVIISLLWTDHYIEPLNHIEYQNENGDSIDPDAGKPRVYGITEKGLELLDGNTLESEHEAREWKRWQRNVSFYGAIIGTIISTGLLILKLIEWLNK